MKRSWMTRAIPRGGMTRAIPRGVMACAVSLLMASAGVSLASEAELEPCTGPHCDPPTQKVKFDVYCLYDSCSHDGPERCEVETDFHKLVTINGGEVADSSHQGSKVFFKVRCEDDHLGKKHLGTRFTSLLRTRFETSHSHHYAAFSLPRGSLHVGNHEAPSTLEIRDDLKLHSLSGRCFIKTTH